MRIGYTGCVYDQRRRVCRTCVCITAIKRFPMPDTSILIFGPPSAQRDSYELSARRHSDDVKICENSFIARSVLQSTAVRSVLIMAGTSDSHIEQFLSILRGDYPHIPVFFMGETENERSIRLMQRMGTVVLPPEMPAVQLETILFPGINAAADATRLPESRTVVFERTEYPIEFVRAKAQFESQFIRCVLNRERGNVSKTARVIGMARRNLQLKIQMHKIDLADIRREK